MPHPATPTKAERRVAARESARAAMVAQKKRDARHTVLLRSGVIVGILAFITIVAIVIVSGIRPAGPGPRNMASDGIVIGKNFVASATRGLPAGGPPIPTKAEGGDAVAHITLFSDFLCPNCGTFEKQNGEYIEKLVKSGAATIEYHPIAILDRFSQGTKYSTRATNLAAAVANYAPNSYFAVNKALFAAQPGENTAGLTDKELLYIVGTVRGITNLDKITSAVESKKFFGWVSDATKRAATTATKGTDLKEFKGTPTVLVNGRYWSGEKQTFEEFVASALPDTKKKEK